LPGAALGPLRAAYLLLWVHGLIVDKASSANFVPVNTR